MEKTKTKNKDTLQFDKSDFQKQFQIFSKPARRNLIDVVMINTILLASVALAFFVPIANLGLAVLVYLYLRIGVWGFCLKKARGDYARYEEVFLSLKKVIKAFCLTVVKSVYVLLGLVLLIVPGILWALDFCFCSLILSENNDLDVKAIMLLSKNLAYGYRLQIFLAAAISAASVCVASMLSFLIVLCIDLFIAVSPFVYALFVISFSLFVLVVFALPSFQFAVVESYLEAKLNVIAKSKQTNANREKSL